MVKALVLYKQQLSHSKQKDTWINNTMKVVNESYDVICGPLCYSPRTILLVRLLTRGGTMMVLVLQMSKCLYTYLNEDIVHEHVLD